MWGTVSSVWSKVTGAGTSPNSPSPTTPSVEGTPSPSEKKPELSEEQELALLQEQQEIYNNYDPEEEALKYQERENSKYNVLVEFIKQLKPGTEMYRVSVPAFILQPISLLEKLSVYSTPSDLIDKIAEIENAETRFVVILKWVLSTWRSIPRFGVEGVKPYNPILGEQFYCTWDHKDTDGSTSEYIAEQVSHHPPISAFYMCNPKRQFIYHGWVYPKTTLHWNSFGTHMEGEFFVELPKFGEVYTVKHPPVSASNVLWGKKTIEIYEKLFLSCEKSGLSAEINFFAGKNNALEGEVKNRDGTVLFKIAGEVNTVVKITDVRNGQEATFYESSKIKKAQKFVKPVHEQRKYESRRNWHRVTYALRKEDFEDANLQKFTVEERERGIRKERKERNDEWVPKLFKKIGEGENGGWRYIYHPFNQGNTDSANINCIKSQ